MLVAREGLRGVHALRWPHEATERPLDPIALGLFVLLGLLLGWVSPATLCLRAQALEGLTLGLAHSFEPGADLRRAVALCSGPPVDDHVDLGAGHVRRARHARHQASGRRVQLRVCRDRDPDGHAARADRKHLGHRRSAESAGACVGTSSSPRVIPRVRRVPLRARRGQLTRPFSASLYSAAAAVLGAACSSVAGRWPAPSRGCRARRQSSRDHARRAGLRDEPESGIACSGLGLGLALVWACRRPRRALPTVERLAVGCVCALRCAPWCHRSAVSRPRRSSDRRSARRPVSRNR